jgi:hypothetical protein
VVENTKQTKAEASPRLDGWSVFLEILKRAWRDEGPFVGVIGFS